MDTAKAFMERLGIPTTYMVYSKHMALTPLFHRVLDGIKHIFTFTTVLRYTLVCERFLSKSTTIN